MPANEVVERTSSPVGRKQRVIPKGLGTQAALLCGCVLFLFPLAWMVSTSLKPIEQAMTMPPQWWPDPIRFRTYVEAVQFIPFLEYTVNTLTISLLATSGMVLSSSLVAYGFARFEFPGRNLLFMVTLATMMVPFQVTMIPLYAVFRELHWIGTMRPLWVPSWCGAAFNIFLLRQFFLTIPRDLHDAAHMDGCSEFGIFWRVVLPLSRPALAMVAVFHFMHHWNDFMAPLIYLTEQADFTLALGLQQYQSQHGATPWNMLMAASTLVTLPIIVLFFLMQKTFVQGVKMSGLKG